MTWMHLFKGFTCSDSLKMITLSIFHEILESLNAIQVKVDISSLSKLGW